MADLRARTEGRVEWEVLEWNEEAIDFYQRLGARPMAGWTRYRWTLPRRPTVPGAAIRPF